MLIKGIWLRLGAGATTETERTGLFLTWAPEPGATQAVVTSFLAPPPGQPIESFRRVVVDGSVSASTIERSGLLWPKVVQFEGGDTSLNYPEFRHWIDAPTVSLGWHLISVGSAGFWQIHCQLIERATAELLPDLL